MGQPTASCGTVGRIHKPAGRTRGTEPSQYPEERTSTETPEVAASEPGPGQWSREENRKRLERRSTEGDRPVRVGPRAILE